MDWDGEGDWGVSVVGGGGVDWVGYGVVGVFERGGVRVGVGVDGGGGGVVECECDIVGIGVFSDCVE